MEQLIINGQLAQDVLNACGIGIRDEDLTEFMLGHQSDDLLHTFGIKLIKNIIEQKDGMETVHLPDEIKLAKLQGYQECFLLALASARLTSS